MTLKTMIAVIASMAALGVCAIPVTRENLAKVLLENYMANDDVTDGFPVETFDGNFSCFATNGVIPRSEIVSNLCDIACDYCSSEMLTNTRHRAVLNMALSSIEEFCLPDASNAVEYVFSNAVDMTAYHAASPYVRLHGLGHDAFETYHSAMLSTNAISTKKARCLVNAVYNRCLADDSNSSIATTNRLSWLCLEAARLGVIEFADPHFCGIWSGYATSSNRFAYIEGRLALPGNAGNTYLLNIRNQLLALPPGTMQMLPTNQFYNVED